MKKLFTLLALVGMMALPMTVFAESTSKMSYECTAKLDDTSVQVCTVKVTTTGDPATELSVKLTANNATINQSSIEAATGWVADSTAYPTIKFTNSELGGTDTYNLFTFEYTPSTNGEECTVVLEAANDSVTISTQTKDTDTTTENKQTGASLPYVFLGGALLIAGYAFVTTKNKSKMYKI